MDVSAVHTRTNMTMSMQFSDEANKVMINRIITADESEVMMLCSYDDNLRFQRFLVPTCWLSTVTNHCMSQSNVKNQL